MFPDGDGYRLLVAVADVDVYVGAHSPIDVAARVNTTSVYTGVKNFPMLPDRLSYDLTSLLAGKSRRAMVVEMRITPDGQITGRRIFPALVENKAKLCYDAVADWLEGKTRPPEPLAGDKELRLQVETQDRLARVLRRVRMAAGALEFATLETRIVMGDNGRVKDIVSRSQNRAERIIEELMVACNQSTAAFLAGRNLPVFSRVVREPERWARIVELAATYHSRLPAEPDARALSGFLRKARLARPDAFTDLSLAVIKLIGRGEYHVLPGGRIPEGHFGLALNHYAHSTAPNRRYPDLVTQRLLKAALAGGRAAAGKERLFPGQAAVPGPALHRAGGRGQQGGAPGEEERGGRAAGRQARQPVPGAGHRQLGQGDLGAHQAPPGGGQAAARRPAAQGRRPPARPAGGHQRGKRLYRFRPGLKPFTSIEEDVHVRSSRFEVFRAEN